MNPVVELVNVSEKRSFKTARSNRFWLSPGEACELMSGVLLRVYNSRVSGEEHARAVIQSLPDTLAVSFTSGEPVAVPHSKDMQWVQALAVERDGDSVLQRILFQVMTFDNEAMAKVRCAQ